MNAPAANFQARPLSRLYRQGDGSFSDVSPARIGKSRPRCVMSQAVAADFVRMGIYRVEALDEYGASVLVEK